jgi:hypothetical protein
MMIYCDIQHIKQAATMNKFIAKDSVGLPPVSLALIDLILCAHQRQIEKQTHETESGIVSAINERPGGRFDRRPAATITRIGDETGLNRSL